MPDPILILPVAIIFGSALAALVAGMLFREDQLRPPRLAWVLSLGPLTAFVLLLLKVPWLQSNLVYTWQINWMKTAGLKFCLYYDSLSALFALLITLIGALVVIYAGQYFKGKPGSWRFFCYILLFMGFMLGLVMAGDVLTLFMAWEGTSIVSFLLVAYEYKSESARKGAFKALFITAGGGLALLIGLLFMAQVAGGTRFLSILGSGDALRDSRFYTLILGMVALGAFTKSAQFPFHVWLPDAMSAPTPASAYLHSATMVKAGIYLMARFNPVLGLTETWFWLLTLAGMASMLTGAYQGLKKNDLKAMLAYTTICQLGILMMMIGQDMAISFKALVIGILAHALYKSALFLVVGIVDHATGTRDLRRLGGLRRSMPITFGIALVASLSMAGLPPLFGFLAKETLLATAVHPSLPPVGTWVLVVSSVMAGALMFAISARFIRETFLGKPGDPDIMGHEAPAAMLLAPAIPALVSLVLAQIPGPKTEAALLANAAGAAYGSKVKVSLALWTGLNVPLVLSLVAIAMGVLIFIYRNRMIEMMKARRQPCSLNTLYDSIVAGMDMLADMATRLQQGKLRLYLVTMLASAIALVVYFGNFSPPVDLANVTWPALTFSGELLLLRLLALLLIGGTALVCVLLRNDFFAIMAFGASGLGVAVLMALEPAPDVALVQIVVDILMVIILVLALSRLPKQKLQKVHQGTFKQHKTSLLRDILVSGALGTVVMLMSLAAMLSRPRFSALTPFFEANAKTGTGSNSIVGAIITDFRGMDTLIEIAVFSIAGIGIFTLLCASGSVSAENGLTNTASGEMSPSPLKTLGIGGRKTTPLIRGLANLILPLAMLIGICDLLFAHEQPGDGFTAGVIVSIGIGFRYIVYGYHETRGQFGWLKPSAFIGWGLLLAVFSGVIAIFFNGSFFSNVDFGKLMGLPLPPGIHLGTSLMFETAIALSVLGSVTHMLNALGHPGEKDREWNF